MSRTQIAVEVQTRLNRGDSKHAIYAALKADYPAAAVERSLAQWPLPADKEKNKHFNYTLLIIASFFTALKLLQVIGVFHGLETKARVVALLPILLYGYIIYGIKNFNLLGYLLIILFGIQNILYVMQLSERTPNAFMLLGLSRAAIALGLIQKNRLFPNTSWLMRHKRDASGNPIF